MATKEPPPANIKKTANPFYVILVVAGVVFSITACAYGVMAVKLLDPSQALAAGQSGEGLIRFLDQHGLMLLVAELIVLAVATFAAIATDS